MHASTQTSEGHPPARANCLTRPAGCGAIGTSGRELVGGAEGLWFHSVSGTHQTSIIPGHSVTSGTLGAGDVWMIRRSAKTSFLSIQT